MSKLQEVITQVKEKLSTTPIYDKLIKQTLKDIQDSANDLKIPVKVSMGGSYAKGTHIGDSFDCDIFLRFEDLTNYQTDLPKILKPIAKKLKSKLDLIHGSRDYYQIPQDKLTLEIIPVKLIEKPEEATHIMDYSPFHVDWVKKELTKKQLVEDIKLMKLFLKSIRVYGAESYVSGFSGHVNDILVLYYGGFEKAIEKIAKWNPNKKTVIDYNNSYKGMDVEFFMNDSKTLSPLIAIDPIDKDRNAAAALNQKSYIKIIEKAKEFLKAPSDLFFEKEIISKESIEEKFPQNYTIQIKVVAKDGKTDIVGAKLVKALEYYERRLSEEGFVIVNTDWEWDLEQEANFFITTTQKEIPSTYLRKGPSLSMEKAITAFKTKNRNAEFIEQDGNLFVKLKRFCTDTIEAAKGISKEDYLKEKVQESTL